MSRSTAPRVKTDYRVHLPAFSQDGNRVLSRTFRCGERRTPAGYVSNEIETVSCLGCLRTRIREQAQLLEDLSEER